MDCDRMSRDLGTEGEALYTGVECIVWAFLSFLRHSYSTFIKEEAGKGSKAAAIIFL